MRVKDRLGFKVRFLKPRRNVFNYGLCLRDLQLLSSVFKIFLRKTFKKSVSTTAIRKLLKNGLWFSFRRGSPKDRRAKDLNLLYLQVIFRWRMIDWIGEGMLLANINEVWCTISVRTNFSWLPKVKTLI